MTTQLRRMLASFLRLWRHPTPAEVAAHQLAQARLALLESEEEQEFWLARTAMLRQRIGRLSAKDLS